MKKLEQIGDNLYAGNGVFVGKVVAEVDGYYVFYPETNGGFYDEGFLLQLTTHLRKKNAEWDVQVQTDPVLAEPKPVDFEFSDKAIKDMEAGTVTREDGDCWCPEGSEDKCVDILCPRK